MAQLIVRDAVAQLIVRGAATQFIIKGRCGTVHFILVQIVNKSLQSDLGRHYNAVIGDNNCDNLSYKKCLFTYLKQL